MRNSTLGETSINRAALWYELYDLEVRHWHDVNNNQGRTAHEFYTEHGLFAVGETKHEGREAIREFYAWRRTRGARVAKHIVNNVSVDLDPGGRTAWVTGVVTLFAADGAPILEAKPPTMVADLKSECRLGEDLQWRYQSHVLVPLFRGEGHLNSGATRPRT